MGDNKWKSQKVVCRVCHKEVVKQNYSYHLKEMHREENPNDTRPHGQPKFSFVVKKQKPEIEKPTEDDPPSPRARSRSPIQIPEVAVASCSTTSGQKTGGKQDTEATLHNIRERLVAMIKMLAPDREISISCKSESGSVLNMLWRQQPLVSLSKV